MAEVVSLEEAVALVPSGARLGIGGVLLKRKPIRFLLALAAAGRVDLRVATFLASLDVELLAAYETLREVSTGYVGFEHLGFAPRYQAAVAAGVIAAKEYTEFLFISGLRAAMAGLPFMPAKGGAGSDVLEDLGFREIDDPYGGETVIAVPPLRPEITVIHSEAADRRGNVLGPASRDFLFDFDANIARAADLVIVSTEALLDEGRLAAESGPPLLYGYEVDVIVTVPRGAWPTALPGHYGPDLSAIRRYLAAASDDAAARKALEDMQ